MKTTKKTVAMIALCISQFFIQCTNDDKKIIEEKVITEKESDEIIQLKDYLSKSFAIDLEKIIYNSNKSTFVIEGDMLISIEDVRRRFNYPNSSNKTNQRVDRFTVAPEITESLKVYVVPEVTAEWRAAINQAIAHWNNINSSVNLTIVNSSISANITINVLTEGPGSIAYGYLPEYNLLPGKMISINTYYDKLEPYKKLCTMTHEIGHTLGLLHTNEERGSLIPCTPLSDVNSVMQVPVYEWTGFNYYDNIAISTLYPVGVGTKKLYRYKKNQYYFYTTNPCEITPEKDGYIFDGDAGYLYSTQVSGTVPLYRILNGTIIKDHRLNKVRTSPDDVILGYLFTSQQPGTTALYSYGIYESKNGETPSYAYHYNYTTTDSEVILKSIIGYVSNNVITKDGEKVLVWL